MREAVLIFPNQLYDPHPAVSRERLHVIIEEPRFFSDSAHNLKFHKQKLMLHRASMKYYENEVLKKRGMKCEYVEHGDNSSISKVLAILKGQGVKTINLVDPTDYILEDSVRRYCETLGLNLMFYETPNFLTTKTEIARFLKTNKNFDISEFYIRQRKRLGLLVDEENSPVGGSWMFFTKTGDEPVIPTKVPPLKFFRSNKYVDEARLYVEKKFSDHPGLTREFIYPISQTEAKAWFDNFLKNRFDKFGIYKNTFLVEEPFTFNSMLSSSLNIGLISPQYVLQRLNRYLSKRNMPIDIVEPFVRCLVGWREFARASYLSFGLKQKEINYFFHTRKLSGAWYGADTGLAPLDEVLKRIITYGYCANSQRLKVVGNAMLLCEVDPDEVYRWFMEMLIDSYDWVVTPNIYGISQFADGGLLIPRPKIFSSKDILNCSNFDRDAWTTIWDSLYFRFIFRHKALCLEEGDSGLKTKDFLTIPEEHLRKYLDLSSRFISRATW